jgi:hypothetical protein
MSTKTVRKNLSKNLLKLLNSETNKATRKGVSNQKPQLLFLEDLEFINDTIKELIERKHISSRTNTYIFEKQHLEWARGIAEHYQDFYLRNNQTWKGGKTDFENTQAGMYLKQDHPKEYKKIIDGKAFIISSWGALSKCKEELVRGLVETSEKQMKEILKRIDRGHGAGSGIAVSGMQQAMAANKLSKSVTEEEFKELTGEFKKHIDNAFKTGEITAKERNQIKSVFVDYKNIVNPKTGKVKTEFIPFITFQDKYTNRVTDRQRESIVLDIVRDFFNKMGAGELASMEGSPSVRDKMFAAAMQPWLNHTFKGLNPKITFDKKTNPRGMKYKTAGRTRPEKLSVLGGGSLSLRKAKKAVMPPTKKEEPQRSGLNITAILGLLNQKLPQQVANNMGPPRLENVTGRFAQSVRATDIMQTPQGFPSIGYTYAKEPYQVYESTSGSRFSDPIRDPRPLIDASIREIVAQFGLGRLYTRRQ